MQDSEQITLNSTTLKNEIFEFVVSCAFLIYYTYAYSTIPTYLLNENLTRWFLVYIILSWLWVVVYLINIRYIMLFYNFTFHTNFWNTILPYNKYPFAFIKLIPMFLFGIIIYFVTKFIPLQEDKCDIFENVHHACQALKIISVCGMIVFSLLAFLVFILMMAMCCGCFLSICGYQNVHIIRVVRNSSIVKQVKKTASQLLPITKVGPPDNVCSICYADPVENEKWRQLICNHKFHPDCIDPWIRQHNTCPLCRAEQPANYDNNIV